MKTRKQLEEQYGVPQKENVDYQRIYLYDTNVVNIEELFIPYLKNRGGRFVELERHIKEIAKSMMKYGGWAFFPPIIVDINTLRIADGFGRNSAIIELVKNGKLENVIFQVIYKDIPEEQFNDIVVALNSGQKNWGLLDYTYNWSMMGNDNIKRFIKFCEDEPALHNEKGITPRYATAILKKNPKAVQTGSLLLTDDEVTIGKVILHEALYVMKVIDDIEINGHTGGWVETYFSSWREFRNENSESELPFSTFIELLCEKKESGNIYAPINGRKEQWIDFFNSVTIKYFKAKAKSKR